MLRALIIGTLVCGYLEAYVWAQSYPTNLTVAQDGSGDYHTINEAVQAAPNNSDRRFYIKIKSGVYRETVYIEDAKKMLTLVGDGMSKTIIIGNKSNRSGFRPYESATTRIRGTLFAAIDITFENDAGPQSMQAVALSSEVDSAFFRYRFMGFQDTLLAAANRQFYRECHIYGTVDFIWGNARVVFQKSIIFVRNPLQNQFNVIIAQGRTDPKGKEGIVLHDCYIKGTEDFNKNSFKTYMGRPWKTYSRVVVMQSYINDLIDPQGWVKWNKYTQTDKLFFGEYGNRGLGAATKGRVNWTGVKFFNSYKEASFFTVRNFIDGYEWIPSIGIPFDPDLL